MQFLRIYFVISSLLVASVHCSWMYSRDQFFFDSMKCLTFVDNKAKCTCVQELTARPENNKFTFEIPWCRGTVFFKFGENNHLQISELDKAGYSTFKVTVHMDGKVSSDPQVYQSSLQLDPIVLDETHEYVTLTIDPGICSVLFLEGYPVHYILDFMLTVIFSILGCCLLIIVVFLIVKWVLERRKMKKKKKKKREKSAEESSAAASSVGDSVRLTTVAGNGEKFAVAGLMKHRAHESEWPVPAPVSRNQTTRIDLGSNLLDSGLVNLMSVAGPGQGPQPPANAQKSLEALVLFMATKRPVPGADHVFLFSADYSKFKKRWSEFSGVPRPKYVDEIPAKIETNEQMYLDRGPPRMASPGLKEHQFLVDSMAGYLLNIGVVSQAEFKKMSKILNPRHPRRLMDTEIAFFTSTMDSAAATWEALNKTAQEMASNMEGFLADGEKFVKYLNSSQTSEFHSLCFFYNLYKKYLDAVPLLARHLLRLPVQGLFLLLLRPGMSEDDRLQVLFVLRMSVGHLLKRPDLKETYLCYPMNALHEMSQFFEFEKVIFQGDEDPEVRVKLPEGEPNKDWEFQEQYDDVEAIISGLTARGK